jgi:hypothetical protein
MNSSTRIVRRITAASLMVLATGCAVSQQQEVELGASTAQPNCHWFVTGRR